MARGGARPGAARPVRKSANTSPPSTRARARAREATGNQKPWPADKVERWAIDRTIIEAYDFLLYVQVAPLVFAKLFFPSSDPLVGTLQAFYGLAESAVPAGAAPGG